MIIKQASVSIQTSLYQGLCRLTKWVYTSSRVNCPCVWVAQRVQSQKDWKKGCLITSYLTCHTLSHHLGWILSLDNRSPSYTNSTEFESIKQYVLTISSVSLVWTASFTFTEIQHLSFVTETKYSVTLWPQSKTKTKSHHPSLLSNSWEDTKEPEADSASKNHRDSNLVFWYVLWDWKGANGFPHKIWEKRKRSKGLVLFLGVHFFFNRF